MSLIRQVWLLVLSVVLLALIASVGVTAMSARDAMQTQLGVKNIDNAQALGIALSQQRGDDESMALLLSAQFDTGSYRRIRLQREDGKEGFAREATTTAMVAPAWFARWLPIEAATGVAQVSSGWRRIGSVEVESQTVDLQDELWRGCLRATELLALVALVVGGLSTLALRAVLRPLDATVQQAQALVEGRYLRVPEPRIPELRRVAKAMNVLVQRVHSLFEAHAVQVEALRREAHMDALTGVSQRWHFVEQLSTLLLREDGVDGGGLLLVRLARLAEVNRQLGREATDRALVTIASTLQAYPDRVTDCFAGRLNGSDFALVLPAQGFAAETAQSLLATLQASLAALGPGLAVHVGAVEMPRNAQAEDILAQADLALARAESRGPFAVEVVGAVSRSIAGEQAWHERITSALREGRTRLVEFPVLNRRAEVVHLECPLRLQLDQQGGFEPAARWLPLALRSRLTAMVDTHAIELALLAIQHDGQPRGVNVALASLLDSGFVGTVRQMMHEAPRQARHLWIEVAEAAAVERFELVQEFGRVLRPLGVRFGLEHAGQRLHRIERLYEMGLDYVKLDASLCVGISRHPSARDFVGSAVTLLHALSVQVQAEGVVDVADAELLWAAGVDAITGPWASMVH